MPIYTWPNVAIEYVKGLAGLVANVESNVISPSQSATDAKNIHTNVHMAQLRLDGSVEWPVEDILHTHRLNPTPISA